MTGPKLVPGVATLLVAILLVFNDPCLVFCQVNKVPDSIRNSLDLDSFYQKHLDVGGFPVVGSDRVSDGNACYEYGSFLWYILCRRYYVRYSES